MSLLVAVVLASSNLAVGVTLHPYYSWTANVTAGLPIDVQPVLPGDVDVGAYQPRPEDVAKLAALDVLIVNGIGHDDFIFDMLRASGNSRCRVLRVNEGTPLLRSANGADVNSHTFLSYGNAVMQSYAIARELGELRPELKWKLQENATAYARRLRSQRVEAQLRLTHVKTKRVVTVHDGYRYLLQELGVELVGVVEPAHGLVPSASELGEVVKVIQREHVEVVLSEQGFPRPLLAVLEEAGAHVAIISHIAMGAFTAEKFEQEMRANVDALVTALQ